jgi:hypothetical protein
MHSTVLWSRRFATGLLPPQTVSVAGWPRHPYRGLDFYHETEARLFRERDGDVAECAEILLGFGVKILLLQGSSGSGKSSFLRAGLIPHLKKQTRGNFFLNGRDSVIRCTADPVAQISGALIVALDQQQTLVESGTGPLPGDADEPIAHSLCLELRAELEWAMSSTRQQAVEAVADVLVRLCGELPGKLILILDQAEEVLTRPPDDRGAEDAATAFFRFLEEIYLRNVDARLVVALRTEYYGRFRDELRISDDRLGKRPRSGGIDAYLLRPLRDKKALLNLITAPVGACDEAGAPVYDFTFEVGLPERIAGDLLAEFPHAAVTPALQVVCASLYSRLTQNNRTITSADYNALEGIRGIVRSYVARGIAAAVPRADVDADKWRLLLHSLVSRQGGGTVVSLNEPLKELVRRARDLGIDGDIDRALADLTRGAVPLLRGEPPDDPRFFSLKHDILAVVLSRWFHEHKARLKAKREEAAKRRLMLSIALPSVFAIVLGAALFSYERGQEALRAKSKALQITNLHAIRAPDGDFRTSLLLTLANVDATTAPTGIFERIGGGSAAMRADALSALREVLPRTPWFAGRFAAVGFDPAENRLALLRDKTKLLTFTFPGPNGERAAPLLEAHDLPDRELERPQLRPAAGFVRGLGPVALVDGYIYWWDERGDRQECDLQAHLPTAIVGGSWIRAEFVSGRLQLSTTERHGPMSSLRVLRLDGSDLRRCADAIAVLEPLSIPLRSSSRPAPVFTDTAGEAQMFEYLKETDEPLRENAAAANLPVDPALKNPPKLVVLDAVLDTIERPDAPLRIAVGQVAPERGIPERLHYTIGFAANAPATVFKFDGPKFYVYNIGADHFGNRSGHLAIAPQEVTVTANLVDETWRLRPGRLPWLYPPLAAARIGQHWRVAWLAPNGVWAVEASDSNPGRASPILNAPLIGEPDGMKLQFTADGEFLVLTVSRGPRTPVGVRVWNLRPSWHAWIADDHSTSERDLREAACRVVRADGDNGALGDTELDLFQIDPAYREPCPLTNGASQ